MTTKSALMVSGALTAFVLVIAVATVQTLSSQTTVTAQEAPVRQQEAPRADSLSRQSPTVTPATTDPNQPSISADQASQAALTIAPGASLSATPELVRYGETLAYEVRLNSGTVYVDAEAGTILNGDVAGTLGQAPVSAEQAATIAQSYLGGGSVQAVQLNERRGVAFYEVYFTDGREIYVLAESGQIVQPREGGRGERQEREHTEEDHD